MNSNGYDEYDSNMAGMTLRDYFAAKAMQSLLIEAKSSSTRDDPDNAAAAAYEYADAMLKVRAGVVREPESPTKNLP